MLALSVLAPQKKIPKKFLVVYTLLFQKCKFPSQNQSMMNQDNFFLSMVERANRREEK